MNGSRLYVGEVEDLDDARRRAQTRLRDHEATCDICRPAAGNVTQAGLMAHCPQGRVLTVNANRAEDLWLRAMQLAQIADTAPVAVKNRRGPGRPRKTAAPVAAASVDGEPY